MADFVLLYNRVFFIDENGIICSLELKIRCQKELKILCRLILYRTNIKYLHRIPIVIHADSIT